MTFRFYEMTQKTKTQQTKEEDKMVLKQKKQETKVFSCKRIFGLVRLFVISILISCFLAGISYAQTEVGGPIAIDMTWTEDNSPYILVVQHIEVAEDATLTIEPGVRVKFEDYALMIRGALVARGTKDKMITFTSNQDSPEPGDWKGIQFKDLSVDATFDEDMNYVSGSILEYCKVEFANTAVEADSASPFVNRCLISNNYRGIVLSSKDVSPFISHSSISNHRGTGINLSCEGDASPIIDGCSISNNDNGGIYISSEDAAAVRNSTITGNRDFKGGGGVYVEGGNVIIDNNIVTENTARSIHYGGGIYVSGGTVTISNSTITENDAKGGYTNGWGGGIYVFDGTVTIHHNIISKNTAKAGGGGIYVRDGSVTIDNNTVTGNITTERKVEGGIVVSNRAETVTISDNIVTGNEIGGIYLRGKAIVEKNLISNNTGVGINAEGELDISHNVITQNAGVGVEISNANVVINYCNFYDNEYAVRNNTSSEIDAKNNWWSTTDALRINQKIYDFFDEENLGKVLYNPFLMSPDTDAPVIAPIGLTATPEGTMINLTWKPIELDDLAGYKLYYDSDSEEPPFEGTDAAEGKSPIDVGKVTNFKLSGLRPETKYQITVTAYDTQGNEGWYAEIVTAETAEGELKPPLPPELSSPDDLKVIDTYTPTLKWSASERATSYGIQIAKDSKFSEKEIDQSGITDVQYDVPPDNLKNLETYYWRVNATNSAGTSDWSEVRTFKLISGPSFTISLATGLNFVSLAMKPDVPYTARSFAEKLDSTAIIRYDAPSQKFVPYVPEVSETDGFVIEGGQGYIVNVLEEKQVTFTGTLWTNTPPASPKQTPDKENAVWAFVVAGNLPIELRNSGNLTISVRNVERNIHREFQPPHSEFSVAFVNSDRSSVIEAGEQLEISVKDADGILVAQKQITVQPKDLAKAFVVANPRYNPIPKSSVLLQNYPNPFNPETWIPFKLAEHAETSILIYDVAGRIIRILRLGKLSAGVYTSKNRAAYWDGLSDTGEEVASGVYFYTITASGFRSTRRMVIVR